ncbi:unnamed protein product [Caenorhabditis angaria]|uniref:Uncharacterized protein n=1 Tax=Caenorhabditis angaria TaxID=860376 RepID=A0A9P1N0R3_9PELO|nr:unnamed protein product [Caenorhabditis angaria]
MAPMWRYTIFLLISFLLVSNSECQSEPIKDKKHKQSIQHGPSYMRKRTNPSIFLRPQRPTLALFLIS